MDDPFISPKEVLSRARDHINDLYARIEAFFEAKPYTRHIDFDHETGQDVYKIKITEPLPRVLSTIAKDAFSNIRDSLDHAVYASAVAIRGGSPRDTAFPFANDAIGVHDLLNTKLTGVPPEIRTMLESFQPHKAGNQALWGLNRTRNTKTHRFLVPLAAASIGGGFHVDFAEISGASTFGYSRWDASRNEVEFMRMPQGAKFDCKVNIAFSVLLGDVEVFGGMPIIEILNLCAREAQAVIDTIEAEALRISRHVA